MKDTGARPCELERVRLRDIDFNQKIIYLPSRKGSRGRPRKLKTQTVAMLKRYIASGKYKSEERIFPTSNAMTHGFMRQRNRLAEKLQDTAVRTIRFYDLRHFFATETYLRTRDIVFVKNELGHKSISNTLRYIHLVNFKDDEWISKVAQTVDEACKLVEAGFEYVCEVSNAKIFRKRK